MDQPEQWDLYYLCFYLIVAYMGTDTLFGPMAEVRLQLILAILVFLVSIPSLARSFVDEDDSIAGADGPGDCRFHVGASDDALGKRSGVRVHELHSQRLCIFRRLLALQLEEEIANSDHWITSGMSLCHSPGFNGTEEFARTNCESAGGEFGRAVSGWKSHT